MSPDDSRRSVALTLSTIPIICLIDHSLTHKHQNRSYIRHLAQQINEEEEEKKRSNDRSHRRTRMRITYRWKYTKRMLTMAIANRTVYNLGDPRRILEGGAQHRDVYQCFRVFVAAWIDSSAQVSRIVLRTSRKKSYTLFFSSFGLVDTLFRQEQLNIGCPYESYQNKRIVYN